MIAALWLQFGILIYNLLYFLLLVLFIFTYIYYSPFITVPCVLKKPPCVSSVIKNLSIRIATKKKVLVNFALYLYSLLDMTIQA